MNCVLDEIRWNYEVFPECKEFAQLEADYIFDIVTWESVGVAIDRTDFVEDWNGYYINLEQNIK